MTLRLRVAGQRIKIIRNIIIRIFWLAKWEKFAFPIFFSTPEKPYRKSQPALLNYSPPNHYVVPLKLLLTTRTFELVPINALGLPGQFLPND
jgi:hypothetical protein